MGISYHPFQFLRYAKKKKPLGRVLTLGRQNMSVPEWKLRRLIPLKNGYSHSSYCEDFLKEYLGAESVESCDYSEYEEAIHIVDLNKPLPHGMSTYDTVVDSGTLEHVYNVVQAFENVSRLCAMGGQILHILPCNNLVGHGFWQFSPELFFSLYNEANGYAETEVFVADTTSDESWYQIVKPEGGRRVNLMSDTPLYLLCRTRKIGVVSHEKVQQSDYEYIWERSAGKAADVQPLLDRLVAKLKKRLKSSPLAGLGHYVSRKIFIYRCKKNGALSSTNRNLVRRRISNLVAESVVVQDHQLVVASSSCVVPKALQGANVVRNWLKAVDAELSRVPYGHTLGLYCELQGRRGNRLLKAASTASALALSDSGYVQCDPELPREAIREMVGILDGLEQQRDSGVGAAQLAWTAPFLVSRPETVRLNLPAAVPDTTVAAGVRHLTDRLAQLIGVEVSVLGVTLYRNRTTQDMRALSADWHFDRRPTDWLRFFVYLSDVDSQCGPFHFIDRHNSKRITRQGFKRESGAWQARLQDERCINMLLGRAGSGLVINVERLLHRAGVPDQGRHRDMLEVIFKPRVN